MEENEIEAGNKLIADFMELQTAYQDVQIWMDWKNETIPLWDKRDYWLLRELKYHTSWDWLMPVVEKMEGKDIIFEISRNHYEISKITEFGTEVLYAKSATTKLQAVYTAVIQFITYHNNLNNE